MQVKRPHLIKRLWRAFLWTIRFIGKLFSVLISLLVLVSIIAMIAIFVKSSRTPKILPDTVLVMDLSGSVIDGPPPNILHTANANCDSELSDISDIVFLIDYMFNDGPFPGCN